MDATGRLTYRLLNRDTQTTTREPKPFTGTNLSQCLFHPSVVAYYAEQNFISAKRMNIQHFISFTFIHRFTYFSLCLFCSNLFTAKYKHFASFMVYITHFSTLCVKLKGMDKGAIGCLVTTSWRQDRRQTGGQTRPHRWPGSGSGQPHPRTSSQLISCSCSKSFQGPNPQLLIKKKKV